MLDKRTAHEPPSWRASFGPAGLLPADRASPLRRPPARDEQAAFGERPPCHYCGKSDRLRDYAQQTALTSENERWSAQP